MEGTLPKGWKMVRLGEVCTFQNGLWKGKNPPFEKIKIIRNTNFNKNGTLNLNDVVELDVESKLLKSRLLQYADIILERSGGGPKQPVGRVALFTDEIDRYSFSNFTTRIQVRDKNKVNAFFLWYLLNYFYTEGKTEQLQRQTHGIRNLEFSLYKKLLTPLPPLPTQHKIVEILEEADNLRKLRQKADEKMKDLIPSLFVQMFGDPATNSKGWEVKKLGDIAEIKSGGTPSRKKEEYFKGNITWVTSVSLNKPYLTIDDAKEFITEDAILNSATKLVTRKSVLFGNRVCVGNVSINLCDICFSQDVLAILYQEDLLIPEFLWFYLLQKKVYFERLTRGSTIKGVTVSVLHNTKIPLPPLPLQQEFAECVKEIEAEKERQAEGKKKLDELFNSLMQRAFKGELVA